jgi:hypothetical protein
MELSRSSFERRVCIDRFGRPAAEDVSATLKWRERRVVDGARLGKRGPRLSQLANFKGSICRNSSSAGSNSRCSGTNLINISSGVSPLPDAGASFRYFSTRLCGVVRFGSASAAVGSIPLRLAMLGPRHSPLGD